MTAADAASADVVWPEDAVEVGRIVDAFGVKGWIKVEPFSSDPQALFSSRRWFLAEPQERRPERPGLEAAMPSLLHIAEARDHGDMVIARTTEVSDRDAARALRGARVFVSRASFPTADPNEFYWVDLIGLQVVNRQGENLGTVAGLFDTGPHSVLRVVPATQDETDERLIPFVAAYVDDVSLEARRITVDWGLDY
jgi:16S rRNA processing protein RimM